MWQKLVKIRREIDNILKLLTWTRIFQILVLFIILTAGFLLYELHTEITKIAKTQLSRANTTAPLILSPTTIAKLDKIVSSSNIIVGINVSSVDFHRNTKKILYTSISNPALKEIYQYYTKGVQVELPLFVRDATAGNNLIISTMNGEIVCDTWSYAFSLMPETKEYVKAVCATGIPSYYGKYFGLLSVYLKKEPTSSEVESLKRIMWDLSEDIYSKEFK